MAPVESFPNAGVAQLVEQLICNQQVVGSTPIASSKFKDLALPDLGPFYFLSLLYFPDWASI